MAPTYARSDGGKNGGNKKLARNITIQVGERTATTAGKIQPSSKRPHATNMPRNLNQRR